MKNPLTLFWIVDRPRKQQRTDQRTHELCDPVTVNLRIWRESKRFFQAFEMQRERLRVGLSCRPGQPSHVRSNRNNQTP